MTPLPEGEPTDTDPAPDTPVDNSTGADSQYASDSSTSMNEVHTNHKPTSKRNPNLTKGLVADFLLLVVGG